MSKQFYTYVHFVEETRPFYVGKGSSHRAKITGGSGRNDYYNNVVSKYKDVKPILIPASSEEEALFLEIALIDALRSLGYKLANLTLGGEERYFELKPPQVTKECIICGESYQTYQPKTAKYCSEYCRTFAKRRREGKPVRGTRVEKRLRNTEADKTRYGKKSLRTCIECHKTFVGNYARYCSVACKSYATIRKREPGRKETYRRFNDKIIKQCKICGRDFEAFFGEVCGQTCQMRDYRQRKREENPTVRITYEIDCEVCGTHFIGKNKNRKHCSKRCGSKAFVIRQQQIKQTISVLDG